MNAVVALAGNPNSGKTTLFNALTGSNLRVGNWPGVTVEKREAAFDINDMQVTLIDLPGAYSLTPYSIEEKVTRDFLAGGEYQAILNIADATNLARNLYLTYQLRSLNKPMVVALNMMDELHAAGGKIDAGALSKALGGIHVIPLSAKKRTGFDELFAALYELVSGEITSSYMNTTFSGDPVGANCVRPCLPSAHDGVRARAVRPSMNATFSGDPAGANCVRPRPLRREDNAARAVGDALLYARIRAALDGAGYEMRAAGRAGVTDKLDRLCMHKLYAFPVFLGVLGAMFYLAFGAPGKFLTAVMQDLALIARALIAYPAAYLPAWARDMLLNGIWAGASGVMCFLPQVLILYLCMSAIEDSGYMARAAFITDRLLRKLGLSGRSVIPMLMGFGCTTTAVAAARGVDSERDRLMTVMLTPCMSCGAKLPVYAAFARVFFPGGEFWAVCSLYALGVIAMAATGAFLRARVFKEGDTVFLMELPPYRLPVMRVVARRLRERAGDFITRAGTVIVIMSAVMWFFRYFTPALTPAVYIGDSMLARAGAYLSPLFAPLGFGGWEKAVGLLSGLIAKEGVLSTLQVIYRAPDAAALDAALKISFESAWSAYGYLAFFLLYPPCVSAVAAMRRELGSRRRLVQILAIQLFAAAAASLFIRLAGMLFG